MRSRAIEWICLLIVAVVSSASADPQPPIEADNLPPQARLVDGVVVPVPQEIFRVLDTFQDSNWNSILRPDLAILRPDGSPTKIALSLGLVLGEGFLAISAKDAVEMQDLGRTAVRLARALGIEDSILRRQKSVLDSVDLQDWAAVREEWSNVSEDLKAAMVEIKSEPLSQLISLGGWLRGLEALSALASSRYSPATAKLLRQPEMLGYFEDVIGKMGDRLTEDPSVIATKDGISRLRPLMSGKRGVAPSEREAKEMRDVSKALVDALCAEKKYP